MGVARVPGARPRQHGRHVGTPAVRPAGHRPPRSHHHRQGGGWRQVASLLSVILLSLSMDNIKLHEIED